MIDCSGSEMIVNIKIEFGQAEACTTLEGKFFCNLDTTPKTLSGCVDMSFLSTSSGRTQRVAHFNSSPIVPTAAGPSTSQGRAAGQGGQPLTEVAARV